MFTTADDAWEAGCDALTSFANVYGIDVDPEDEEEEEWSAEERCSRLLDLVRDDENWPDQEDPIEINVHVNAADVPR